MTAVLVDPKTMEPVPPSNRNSNRTMMPLVGDKTVSVQRAWTLARPEFNLDVFAFSDLSVRQEGTYRLQFHLYEIVDGEIFPRASVLSVPFTSYSKITFPGINATADLTKFGVTTRRKKSINTYRRIQRYEYISKRPTKADSKLLRPPGVESTDFRILQDKLTSLASFTAVCASEESPFVEMRLTVNYPLHLMSRLLPLAPQIFKLLDELGEHKELSFGYDILPSSARLDDQVDVDIFTGSSPYLTLKSSLISRVARNAVD
jgi:hypothetical protein